mmetsp:Transcript_39277/g.116869  ORF Transcript_39277/g.116869 Transcript_39277/m.116869 type:complete len:113 (-) Transcript_39277:163-501(-)
MNRRTCQPRTPTARIPCRHSSALSVNNIPWATCTPPAAAPQAAARAVEVYQRWLVSPRAAVAINAPQTEDNQPRKHMSNIFVAVFQCTRGSCCRGYSLYQRGHVPATFAAAL